MKLTSGDVIFLGNGAPAVVAQVDRNSGSIVLERERAKVQEQVENGLKNHLDDSQRSFLNVSINSVKDDSTSKEIQNLYDLIQNYKESKKVDPKVLRYLENELMHRMHRDGHIPANFKVDLRNVPQY